MQSIFTRRNQIDSSSLSSSPLTHQNPRKRGKIGGGLRRRKRSWERPFVSSLTKATPFFSLCSEVETNIVHSMSTLGSSRRGTKRRSRDSVYAKMVLDVDLNSPFLDVDLNSPPVNSHSGEGTSHTSHSVNGEMCHNAEMTHSVGSQHSYTAGNNQRSSQPNIGWSSSSLIDLDAIEDDIQLLSGPPGLHPTRNNTRRRQPVTVILDEDLESDLRSGSTVHKRERNSANRRYINCDYFDLEDEKMTKGKNAKKSLPEAPEAPKEPTFICPVCLNTLIDPISTVCGHIFCKSCIEASIKAQKKCPTCRRKLTMNSFHKVYLPTLN